MEGSEPSYDRTRKFVEFKEGGVALDRNTGTWRRQFRENRRKELNIVQWVEPIRLVHDLLVLPNDYWTGPPSTNARSLTS
jgi:hypothetical protein